MFRGLKELVLPEPDPKELVRKWQSDLRKETRNLDRQIRGKEYILVCPSCHHQAATYLWHRTAMQACTCMGGMAWLSKV